MTLLKKIINKLSALAAKPPEESSVARSIEATTVPVNQMVLETDPERIKRDARYAIDIAKSYVSQMPGGRAFLANKEFVELGPGVNFGTALILLCWGARRATVSDRFQHHFGSFQAHYHIPVYREIVSMLRAEEPNVDLQPLEDVINGSKHEVGRLFCDTTPLEKLAEKYQEAFDITLSNAVFEHLYHPRKAFDSLRRATRMGGMGFHQVDFRDHRDFSRPLEYLLLDEFSFHEMLKERHCECGNRIRPDEMLALFRDVGFDDVEFIPNMWASKEYLIDFVPRLEAAGFSPYADISIDRLQVISGRYVVKR